MHPRSAALAFPSGPDHSPDGRAFLEIQHSIDEGLGKHQNHNNPNSSKGKLPKQCLFFFFSFATPIEYGSSQARESNPSCSCNLCHSCSNAASLTQCITTGTPSSPYLKWTENVQKERKGKKSNHPGLDTGLVSHSLPDKREHIAGNVQQEALVSDRHLCQYVGLIGRVPRGTDLSQPPKSRTAPRQIKFPRLNLIFPINRLN